MLSTNSLDISVGNLGHDSNKVLPFTDPTINFQVTCCVRTGRGGGGVTVSGTLCNGRSATGVDVCSANICSPSISKHRFHCWKSATSRDGVTVVFNLLIHSGLFR